MRGALAVGALMSTLSCAGPNLWTDLGSVSTGRTSRGRTRQPAKIALRGVAWRVRERWTARGLHYGTDELVAAVTRAAQRVRTSYPGSVLGVADLSRPEGGPTRWHGSHHSGRDVDLLFYTTDVAGSPLPPPPAMIRFGGDGVPLAARSGSSAASARSRRFDTQRNWQLIEELLTDPTIRIQWVFVAEPLEARLLAYATAEGRPRFLTEYARLVMNEPTDAPPHDDHFHIRVYCSRADRFHGCEDGQPVWQHEKKTFKYFGPERYDPVSWRRRLGPK